MATAVRLSHRFTGSTILYETKFNNLTPVDRSHIVLTLYNPHTMQCVTDIIKLPCNLRAALVRISTDQSPINVCKKHDNRIQCKHIRRSPQSPTLSEISHGESYTKLSHGILGKCKPVIIRTRFIKNET